jgi:PAS domain S-box-containing protein
MIRDDGRSREELLHEITTLKQKILEMERDKKQGDSCKDENFLVNEKYSVSDLIDLEKLKRIFEKFSIATNFTTGFIEQPSQKVLISTGWRDICTKFHRAFPSSEKYCKESNVFLMKKLKDLKDLSISHCKSGLVDGATPIIIRGKHIANLATGQIFFEKPELHRFKEQGKKYGYNETEYMESVSKVPVVSKEQFEKTLDFLSEIALIIAELGLNNLEIKEKNLKLEELIIKYRQTYNELEESEKKYRELVNSLPEVVFETDEKGNITFVNRKGFSLFGYSEEDFREGVNAIETLIPEDRERGLKNLQAVLGGADIRESEYTALRKDGKTFPVIIYSKSVIHKDKAAGLRGIIIDITDRKKSEEKRLDLERQLRQSQKMEAIGTLAGGVAHDFNNILTGIIGYSYLMLFDTPSGTILHGHLQEILKACNRAKDLAKHILAFSRKGEQKKEIIEIKVIIKEVIQLMKATLPATIEIEEKIEKKSHIILADATQIHQLLMNLCTNAAFAMREKGGKLKVALVNVYIDKNNPLISRGLKEGFYVKLTLSDTGCGMTEKVIERIFEPYFTTKEQGEGTGLGLAVVHGIVQSHNGIIIVNSKTGKGSKFHVFFPEIKETAELEIDLSLNIPCGTGKILLVDDEMSIAYTLQKSLEKLGYKVFTTNSSPEALHIFQKDPDRFNLVITDQTMPKMTGIDLAREIFKIRPDIPVFLCTGYIDNTIDENQIKAMGIKELILKPFNIEEIAKLIQNML